MSESATNTSLDIKIDVTSRRECGRKGLARFLFLSQEHLYLRILLEYSKVSIKQVSSLGKKIQICFSLFIYLMF